MMFASRARPGTDPKPYVSERGIRYAYGQIAFGAAGLRFDPRPEYAPQQHNRPSAVLEVFRQVVGAGDTARHARQWLAEDGPTSPIDFYASEDEEAAHARKVLALLAGR